MYETSRVDISLLDHDVYDIFRTEGHSLAQKITTTARGSMMIVEAARSRKRLKDLKIRTAYEALAQLLLPLKT